MPPASGTGSRTGVKVLVGLLVAAVVVGGGALALSGGGDDDGGGSPAGGDDQAAEAGDPAQAVVDYLDAADAGDCGRIVELLAEPSLVALGSTDLDEARGLCQAMVDAGDELVGANIDVQGTSVTANDGSTATVELTVADGGDTEAVPVTVRNEGGAWKVDLMTTNASGGSAPGAPGGGAASPPAPDASAG